MVNNLVLGIPKPSFFMVLGAHGSYIINQYSRIPILNQTRIKNGTSFSFVFFRGSTNRFIRGFSSPVPSAAPKGQASDSYPMVFYDSVTGGLPSQAGCLGGGYMSMMKKKHTND